MDVSLPPLSDTVPARRAAGTSKLMSLPEAIDRFVPDGACLATGLALESLVPFAAGHELIRQRRRDLELVGPISDMLFDQLIGAGCVRKVTAAWVGNVSAGLGHNFRRAVEHGLPRPLALEEHSNFSVGLGLLAATLGVPYLPARTLLGSDLAPGNPRVERGPEGLVHILAIQPDVAILQVQRADAHGHAHCWGNLGLCQEGALAAARVILLAEEVVATDVILSDPNRVLMPPGRVAAVVRCPGGGHPSPVQGYYGRDHAAFAAYHRATRDAAGFAAWLREWVLDLPDRESYLAKLGERWPSLRPSRPRLAAPIDYA